MIPLEVYIAGLVVVGAVCFVVGALAERRRVAQLRRDAKEISEILTALQRQHATIIDEHPPTDVHHRTTRTPKGPK